MNFRIRSKLYEAFVIKSDVEYIVGVKKSRIVH